ncbi:MAG: efflux RND transporter permease subunit, partial [Leptospiraceae bacterium]|nr:efflux RND transporter permease subunit [Leptospiraceae bacterium]
IERIIIRSNDAGQAIRLKDVAEVKAGIEAMDKSVRINGKPGMYLGVAAREGSDILDVVESVVRRVEQFRTDENLPAGLALTSLRDESIETKIRLNIVLQNAVAGFVLVMAVLFFFFNRRIAFWTAAGIPIAIAVALIGIPFLDITINRISLLGLIVVLGMLVDDSIIIAESIYTEMQSGKPPEEAAASGLSKVIRPVISTVITTVFAFVPMYFLGGPVGDFSMEIPTVVILMLVGSLLEALFILPVHLGHAGMPEGGLVEPPGAKLIAGLERRYSRLLQYCLVRRGFIAGSMLTGLVLALGLGILVVRFEMFPVDQAWRMWIYGKTRQDSNLEATERQAMRVESIVQSLPAGVIKSFTTTTGIKWDGTQVLPNLFLMELILSPSTERSMSAEEIKVFAFSRIREQKIPFDMDYYIDGGGPPAGKPIEIQVIGNENTQRLALLDQIQKDLESLGATNVDSNYTA